MKFLAYFTTMMMISMASFAAVQVTPTTLTTSEDGAAITYRVVLDSPPSAGETVTITPASGDVTEGTVSGALTFDLSNYETHQFVTVTPGASGDGNDGDVAYTITNTVASNVGGGNYDGETASSVNATNVNIDGVSVITVSPSSGIFIDEGNNQSITISAAGGPAADVTLTLTIVDATESAVSTTSISLTAGNGFSQTVTLSVPTDGVVDGDQAFTVTTSATTSGDASFNGIDPVDITALAVDIDTAAPAASAAAVPTMSPLFMLIMISVLGGIVAMRTKKNRSV